MNKISTVQQWIAVETCQDTCQDISQVPNTMVQLLLGEGGSGDKDDEREGIQDSRAMPPTEARALADELYSAADAADDGALYP